MVLNKSKTRILKQLVAMIAKLKSNINKRNKIRKRKENKEKRKQINKQRLKIKRNNYLKMMKRILIDLSITSWQVMICIMILMMIVRMKELRNIRLVDTIQCI